MFNWFETHVQAFPEKTVTVYPQNFWSFVWAGTEGLRVHIAVMMLLTAVIGGFEALLFAILGKMVDWLSEIPPALFWQQEKAALMTIALIICISPLVVICQTLIKHQALAGNFPMRLRWNFHRLLLNQSISFYQDEFAGRVAAKVMQTALAVRDMWFIMADIVVFVSIYFVTIVTITANFNGWMVLPFLLWMLSYICSLSFFVPRLARVSQNQADARAIMTGRITDAYTNITTVKLFSHAGREAEYAKSAMQEFLQTVHKQMRLVSGVQIVNHLLIMMLILSTSGTALWLWTHGLLGIGGVAAAAAMTLRLHGISQWLMWEMASLYEQVGTVQDGINVLSLSHTVQDRPDAQDLTITRGEIAFENLSFSYGKTQDRTRRLFTNLTIKIKAGEKVGLVGRSGAGKSTIVNLLLRFYDVDSGKICIDKIDIASITQTSLRAQIGMVTQDTSLLHRSVRENIMYGRVAATENEMIAAAKRAEAHDFIMTLRDSQGRCGYDAHVGERGVKLSGGQRQRIAIARVMLKDAPILLLDEATSALDSEVEKAIQLSLYRLMEGKTVVAIAHRLSTIAAMDRLIVLENGKIIEEGDHKGLLKQAGLYATLWAHQSGGFLGSE